ncbi:MAG: hypothetical protein ACXQS4_02450 [Methermicoccaceae archaeon]
MMEMDDEMRYILECQAQDDRREAARIERRRQYIEEHAAEWAREDDEYWARQYGNHPDERTDEEDEPEDALQGWDTDIETGTYTPDESYTHAATHTQRERYIRDDSRELYGSVSVAHESDEVVGVDWEQKRALCEGVRLGSKGSITTHYEVALDDGDPSERYEEWAEVEA